MRHRIAKLEKVFREHAGLRCPLCFGHPTAVVRELWELDPDGPGYRKTGRIRVEDPELVTEDLRCRHCGAAPRTVTTLVVTREHGWDEPPPPGDAPPEGVTDVKQ